MKVHGDKSISRRSNIDCRNNYQLYRDELKEDFQDICGYCGKPVVISRRDFEIDHFIPHDTAPELENEYNNLVWSCKTCNRKKWSHWPTHDKHRHHDGQKGFVDPATDEYNMHMERIETGQIIGKTRVGEYMCIQAFKFPLRPMEEVYKATCLYEQKDRLKKMIDSASENKNKYKLLLDFFKIDAQLDDLFNYLSGRE